MPESGQHTDKYVYLETFGCQMNDSDSDRLLGFLKDIDYIRTEKAQEADFIIINTCSIRDKAEQKVYSALGRYKSLKKENPGLVIGVAGCVAQQKGEAFLKRVPYLDCVIGTHNIHKIKDILSEVSLNKRRLAAVEFNKDIGSDEYLSEPSVSGVKALVSIMRGCDNFCSYCIVPYTRGREASRPVDEILGEVAALSKKGIREITLIGQNVNSYGRGTETGFTELLRRVCGVEHIKRVRFLTSHPKDISADLVRLFRDEPKLCPHVHLPVQSGSDSVLGRMKRGYTSEAYLEKVAMLRFARPEIALTTDVIVGFPGETERDFRDTIDLLEKVRYDNLFSFVYSARPGTEAAGYDGQIARDVRFERLRILQSTQAAITDERDGAIVGKTVEVLVEGAVEKGGNEFYGRSSCSRNVRFGAKTALAGELVRVLVTGAHAGSLRGASWTGPQGRSL